MAFRAILRRNFTTFSLKESPEIHSKMSRNSHAVIDPGIKARMFQPSTTTSSCDMDVKLRNQLSRILSPEFDVTVKDAGEIINILNVIKAKCAPSAEKFRLLVGLLCQVDLSITSIEEHYEQLLIKNRIFHLLRMFPDVAHPLLDVITRATNRCCPLASLPVTIGKIEEERGKMPVSTGVFNHLSCFRKSSQDELILSASGPGTQQTGIPSPQRLSGVTLPISDGSSAQMTVIPNAGQSLVGDSQPAEFDLSRRMYDQVPPSFRQSSLQRLGGAFNSSGAKESPTDIQKRILLQQQRHLRQQLEILQAQRLQQISCVRNLTFERTNKTIKTTTSATSTTSHNTSDIMAPFMLASSAVIGPSNSFTQSMRMTRSCSQINQQPIGGVDRNSKSSADIQALDLRSPERKKASYKTTSEGSGKSQNPELAISKKLSGKVKNIGSDDLRQFDKTGRENGGEEKEGLLLSQVGRHCIMVSVRDGSVSKTQKNKSQLESAKSLSKQKPKKAKARQSRCKGAVINVNKLCHVHDTRQSKKKKKTHSISDHSRKVANSSKGPNIVQSSQCQQDVALNEHEVQSHADMSDLDPANYNNNNNNKCSSNCKGMSPDLKAIKSIVQTYSKQHKSHKKSKSRKKKWPRGSRDDCKMQGLVASDHEPQQPVRNLGHQIVSKDSESPDPSSKPLDLSNSLRLSQTSGNTSDVLKATNTMFEPLTGLWQRKPDQAKTNQTPLHQPQAVEPISQTSDEVQSLEDTDYVYLLHSGCDDEAWYQSSPSDDVESLSNRNKVSDDGYQSNILTANSPKMRPDSFLGRLAQNRFQRAPALDANSMQSATAAAASLPPTVKRKHPLTRSSKDKNKKKKKH